MSKLFYDHLLIINEVSAELEGLDPKERSDLLAIIDETLHNHVLDVILTHLPKEHHEAFLDRFHKAPHDKTLLTYLREKTTVNIEAAITKRVKEVKRQTLTAINRARK